MDDSLYIPDKDDEIQQPFISSPKFLTSVLRASRGLGFRSEPPTPSPESTSEPTAGLTDEKPSTLPLESEALPASKLPPPGLQIKPKKNQPKKLPPSGSQSTKNPPLPPIIPLPPIDPSLLPPVILPPPLPPAPATMAAEPDRGGLKKYGNDEVPWTGGSPSGKFKKTDPTSHAALRPLSYKDAIKMEETCQRALPESRQIGQPNATKTPTVSLTEWITDVSKHCENTGMDSVFYVRKDPNIDVEFIDLFEDWNTFSSEEIDYWLTNETFDSYDKENLRMSGVHIRE